MNAIAKKQNIENIVDKVVRLKLLQQPQIGILIKELREYLNLTQEELAADLGVAFSTVNRWEKGHAKPSPIALKALEVRLLEIEKNDDFISKCLFTKLD